MEKSLIDREQFFVSDQQTPVVSDPGERSFNDPAFSVMSQLSAILKFRFPPILAVWTNQINLPFFKFFPKRITIVSKVCNQAFGAGFRSARSVARHFDLVHHPVNKGYFVRGCEVIVLPKGTPLPSTTTIHFDPLPLLVFPTPRPLFFAGAKLPSIKASSQSNKDFSSRSAKNLRHTSSQTPSSSHSRKRRQHVEGLGYLPGKSFQRAPVLRIQRIPYNTARLSAWGRPTRPFRGVGSSGSIRFNCSSLINRVCSAIGSPPIAYYTKSQQKFRPITCCIYNILCPLINLNPSL